MRHKLVSPRVSAAIDVNLRAGGSHWIMPASRRASFSGDGIPGFLNAKGVLQDKRDWDNPQVSRLWRYNLHYFDDLNALGAESRIELHRDLISRWIAENPAPVGTGWEPYPCSLRIVNWIKWALAGNELESDWQSSLAIQADWLSKNIEWHLLGNHLFANAKALVFVGMFFEGAAADAWLKTGLEIIEQELPEQILSDGGQFERSPMYHAIALDDVLDLINVAETYCGCFETSTVSEWRATAKRMLGWADAMKHPDGEIALFNDSAFGVAPTLLELEQYAQRLSIDAPAILVGVTDLNDSGYVRAQNDHAVLITDMGEIGPDYLPGHAHADTLSFELSLFGVRWVVDSGCSTYEVGDERLRQRGTAAHNTIAIDRENSSEVWSSFRVARRARPGVVTIGEDADGVSISGSHDGYRRLSGRATHFRTFELKMTSLIIADRVEGSFNSADAYLLFHPDVKIEVVPTGFAIANKGKRANLSFVGGEVSSEAGTWHPEFGISLPTRRIHIRMTGDQLQTRLTWGHESNS